MARHILYLNGKWEARFGAAQMKTFFIVLPVLTLVFIIYRFYKMGKTKFFIKGILLSTFILVFEILNRNSGMRAYYQVSMVFMILCVWESVAALMVKTLKK